MSDNPRIVKPGFYDNVAPEIYHGDSYPGPALSSGILKELLTKSAAHAFVKHPALCEQFEEDKDDGKFDIGSAAHALLLQGEDKIVVADFDSWRSDKAKAVKAEAKAAGLYPLLTKDEARLRAMVEAAKKQLAEDPQLHINDLLKDGKAERTLVWQEDELWFKIRPDWMPQGNAYILDYKTTGMSANPDTLGKHILNMGFQLQEALYRRGFYALKGVDIPFYFFFQETKPPYAGKVVHLDPQFKLLAEDQVSYGIERWRECLSTGNFPGYPAGMVAVECPVYGIMAWEHKRMIEECGE